MCTNEGKNNVRVTHISTPRFQRLTFVIFAEAHSSFSKEEKL